MAQLRELKEALDQGEVLIPRGPQPWDDHYSFEDEYLDTIYKTGQVYIYHPVSRPIELYADFDEFVEAVEGTRERGQEIATEMFGMMAHVDIPLEYKPLEWEAVTLTPEEVAAAERKWKMDRYLGKEPPPPTTEEWEAERARLARMTYQDVRAYYIGIYEKLALEKPVDAQRWRDELDAFKKQNKEQSA
jgi:hypothetical protein